MGIESRVGEEMIGRVISHYKILAKLGEGGMGVVYKAQDTRLKRTVALKFLHPYTFDTEVARQRFIREAQLEAALDHPNICPVYEIDEQDGHIFMAMAYLEGKSLKEMTAEGPLEIADAIDKSVQVARGLAAAHEKGVVHRDIKCSNIMVNGGGHVRITDFGLAEVAGEGGISKVKVLLGSLPYMSPEQTRSEATDSRTDIWSLGVVLYEILTGKLPFQGDFEAAIIYSILNLEPPRLLEQRPGIHRELDHVVHRMIAKSPDERYQTADELIVALVAVRQAIDSDADPISKPSIAVLPFADLSPAGDQEYFCDGIAEEITNALTRVEDLRVVARTSAFSFKGKDTPLPDIGRELGVGTLLSGSVRKSGDRLRIDVRLTNALDGHELWSEQYDRELEDVFAIQDEIRLAIVDRLRVTLFGGDRDALVKRHTGDTEAFNLYWKGRFFWNKRTEEGYRKALSYFQEAIKQDPSYALAYVGIADSYDLLGWYDHLAPEEAFPKAREAAHKALAMDDQLAEAHATTGWICVNYEWSWKCAEREYTRALDLNPGYATAHQWFAEYLSYMGRHDEAKAHAQRAVELDPLSIIINTDLGQVLYYAREYDRAIDQLKKTLEMDSNFAIPYFFLAFAYVQQHKYAEALGAAQTALDLSGGDEPLNVAQMGTIYALSGDLEKARTMLNRLVETRGAKYVSPFCVAQIYMGLGDRNTAFDWLHNGFDAHDHWLETLMVHPVLDGLRDDERYIELLEKMRFDRRLRDYRVS